MSQPDLASLKERFKKSKEKKTTTSTVSGDMYPFWDIKVDESAIIRILRDANKNNPDIFFIDKFEHFLPIDGKDKKIACISMYGLTCPICELSQKYYNVLKDKAMGKVYYRKRKSYLRAVVVKDPLPKDANGESAEGKIKTFQVNYQLMQKMLEQIFNDDEPMDVAPWELKDGFNFIIKKMEHGGYDNYIIGSGFSGKATDITTKFPELFANYEPLDLSTLLPPNPGEDAVHALLQAHLTGGSVPADETPAESPRKPAAAAAADDGEEAPRASRPKVEDDSPAVTKRPQASQAKTIVDAEVLEDDGIEARMKARAAAKRAAAAAAE